jgi:hypothetical protein
MEPYLGLVKFRSIQFDRVDDDEFVVHLLDEDAQVVMTFDPTFLAVEDSWQVKFPNDNVVAQLKTK